MTKRHGADQRSELDPLSPLRPRGERAPTLERGPLRLAHQAEEVVRAPERVEAKRLNPVRDAQPSLPGQPFLTLDHHADLHAHDVSAMDAAPRLLTSLRDGAIDERRAIPQEPCLC